VQTNTRLRSGLCYQLPPREPPLHPLARWTLDS
jgi:hypothetical protein